MGKIKTISWDVYGTLIATHYDECTDRGDIPLRLRPGALEILSRARSREIIQCTSSDGDLKNLKDNLKEAGINWVDFFDELHKMTPYKQKDFSLIIEAYNISPSELLVIGDNYEMDIALAKKQGCQTLHVPELIEYGRNPLDTIKIKKTLDKIITSFFQKISKIFKRKKAQNFFKISANNLSNLI